MSKPAVSAILDEIEARLKNISIANGYFTTALTVERARLSVFNGYDLPAITYWPTSVSLERQYGEEERTLALYIEYHASTLDRPFPDVADELAADVVTALERATTAPKVSDAESIDLGGTVSDLVFEGYEYEIGKGQTPWCGALIQISIKYRAGRSDMFSYSA